MLVYNVIQYYKDYEGTSNIFDNESDDYLHSFSFASLEEAELFIKIARKTKKEDSSRYIIEVSKITSVNEAVDFLDSANGRIPNSSLRLNNYV